MAEWIIGGKRYSIEEYEEYTKQELKRWELDEAEVRRLVGTIGEAFTACDKFMEEHPQYPYGLKDDAEQREFKIYEKLRWNLGAANRAPRCEKVREDGTVCGSPQMKGYSYCYAHERMLRMQSQKLELPTQEDGNGIQMAIMRVQKALIDDEISTKKAGQLLYSLQMASSNLKHTTFASNKEVVTEMRESPRSPSSKKQVLPLISTDSKSSNWQMAISKSEKLPQMNADENTSNWQMADGKSEKLPLINADKRRSGKRKPELPRSAGVETGNPQPGAPPPQQAKTGSVGDPGAPPQQAKTGPVGDPGAVPHENRLG